MRVHTEVMGALHHRFHRAWLSPAPQSPPQSLPAAGEGLTGWTAAGDAAAWPLLRVSASPLSLRRAGPSPHLLSQLWLLLGHLRWQGRRHLLQEAFPQPVPRTTYW